jgi:hypothetical protein
MSRHEFTKLLLDFAAANSVAGTFFEAVVEWCREHQGVWLSHDDLCRLSRAFNDGCNLRLEQDQRINEWLKARISEAAP